MLIRKKKSRYYSSDEIRKRGALYNVIFGERSNGKTYDQIKLAIQTYMETGRPTALVRRWDTDIRGKRFAKNFLPLVENGEVERITKGKWDGIKIYAGQAYLTLSQDEGDPLVDSTSFCDAYALNVWEHDKGGSRAYKTIFFDEFITRGSYLTDEFVIWMNVLSTLIRDRGDVTIYMCGNTVSKYCPYFREMGLKHITKMVQGDIDVYETNGGETTIAVEYADSPNDGKPSDKYFCFDNPRLKMITEGAWEMAVYPHCPRKYRPDDIRFTFFILFDGAMLQCEIVEKDGPFLFIHEKTTPIKDPDHDIIYTPEHDPRPNWRRKITRNVSALERKLAWFFVSENVFYQDNEIGEIVRNYLEWCHSDKVE